MRRKMIQHDVKSCMRVTHATTARAHHRGHFRKRVALADVQNDVMAIVGKSKRTVRVSNMLC